MFYARAYEFIEAALHESYLRGFSCLLVRFHGFEIELPVQDKYPCEESSPQIESAVQSPETDGSNYPQCEQHNCKPKPGQPFLLTFSNMSDITNGASYAKYPPEYRT